MKTTLQVENQDTLGALQGLLKKLLENDLVDILLVPMRTPHGTVTPALVSDSQLLQYADPLAPILPVNSATLVGKLSARRPRARVGAVLRACELRALVELVKMQQACLDDLLLISLDCAGTYNVPTFLAKEAALQEQKNGLWQELFQQAGSQPDNSPPDLRSACQICEQPVFNQAAIHIELLGCQPGDDIPLTMTNEVAEKLGFSETHTNGRSQVVEKLVESRLARREAEFTNIRSQLEGGGGLAEVFAACIRCHNCMTVCPICYCKTCVFKSAVFDHDPLQFVDWTRQKGAFRMPADTMLFHLTRLNHMGLSCVGCGMCTEACPAELPVGMIFRAVGGRLQDTFEYKPGQDIKEPLPLVTFKADEWTEVGE
jgi:formate dehydrogenase subunit beta